MDTLEHLVRALPQLTLFPKQIWLQSCYGEKHSGVHRVSGSVLAWSKMVKKMDIKEALGSLSVVTIEPSAQLPRNRDSCRKVRLLSK